MTNVPPFATHGPLFHALKFLLIFMEICVFYDFDNSSYIPTRLIDNLCASHLLGWKVIMQGW
jgi:hypothetical protein